MTNVTPRAGLLLAIPVIAAIAGGCTESSRPQATGEGSVRGIHAIVDAPEINFLIEERSLGGIQYKQGTGFADYDDLEYTFNFDSLPIAGQTVRRLASQFIDFQADTEYTLVITGSMANPSIMSWEAPERVWEESETVFEMDFVHLSPLLGQVDVYFAETGTMPVDGNQVATMQNGDRVDYREFPAGDYEIIVTAPNDPGNVLFQSINLPAPGANRVTLALYDVDPTITSDVAVALINNAGNATTIPDVNHPSRLRLFHARFGADNVEAYFDSDFDNVVFPDVEFGELTLYADAVETPTLMTLTDVGDPASTVVESNIVLLQNSRSTILFGGPDEALTLKRLRDEGRPLSTFPIARVSSMVASFSQIDIYVLEPGTPIDDQVGPAIFGLVGAADTGYLPLQAGMLELTATISLQKTIVSESLLIDVSAGEVLDIVVLDTADPDMVELRVLDSNQL